MRHVREVLKKGARRFLPSDPQTSLGDVGREPLTVARKVVDDFGRPVEPSRSAPRRPCAGRARVPCRSCTRVSVEASRCRAHRRVDEGLRLAIVGTRPQPGPMSTVLE